MVAAWKSDTLKEPLGWSAVLYGLRTRPNSGVFTGAGEPEGRRDCKSSQSCFCRPRETASAFKKNFDNRIRGIASQSSLEMTNGTQEIPGLVKRLPRLEVRQPALFRQTGRHIVGVEHLVEHDGL